MKIVGKIWKSRKNAYWIAEIPLLDIATEAKNKEELPLMVKDAIELLVNKKSFKISADLHKNALCVEANDQKILMALVLKRQRLRKHLKLEEVKERLGAKSVNDYAQYEQGKHRPSFAKFEQLLKAIDPNHFPVIGYI